MLSGVDSRTRLYFYLLRRPIQFENQGDDEASSVAALGRRKRRAFLEKRVKNVSAYIAWAHDPGLSAVATQKTGGPWWMAYAKKLDGRGGAINMNRFTLHSSIAKSGGELPANWSKQAGALVDDLTPVRVLDAAEGSAHLERAYQPARLFFGTGATGSGMNWRLAVSELEAERRNLRLDGEPVILYSLLSPPGAAKANLLQALYRLDATMTVHARMASAGPRCGPAQNPGSAAPLFSRSATRWPPTFKKPKAARRRWWTRRQRRNRSAWAMPWSSWRRTESPTATCPDRGAPRPRYPLPRAWTEISGASLPATTPR